MPKASQTPSKAKSSTKDEAKTKILKPKSKKNAQSSREPTPTPAPSPSISSTIPTSASLIHTIPIIPTSTVCSPPKTTTYSPELPAKNSFKSTKVKATPRKFVKKVPEAATQGNIVAKESVIQGESVSVTTDQVPHLTSKLGILVSAIDVAPLDTLPPTSENPSVEKFPVEKGVGDLGKEIDPTAVEPVVEEEGRKEPMQNKASNSLDFSWTEDEEDNEAEKEEEVVNSHEEHEAQNIANEEEKSENEGVSGDEKEIHTEDKTEKVSESEGGDDESEEKKGNVSEESEGSMTIGNTVIAPSEEISEETRAQKPGSLLTPFTGDEEVSSDEDDMSLFEVGNRSRKTTV
ncbi:PREDICTED: neurofilament heavy polypeptide-like [Nicotiana attenuata]|uniref:neurofilament heavy polypeptide-like n=1 Tax=Nicotiana attenuata TaxID=49451 RepID=UPI00090525D4|nr:PREDICTED: neurofilament heavy polypeptide-like [Nicotiana attenuata]